MDEELSLPRVEGLDGGPARGSASESPALAPLPPPERGRYRPLRGLDEILDEFLGRAGRAP